MHDIMTLIRIRQDAGRATTFVKVHGHSGDPLHSVADHMPEGKSVQITGSTRGASPSARSAQIKGAVRVHQETLIC